MKYLRYTFLILVLSLLTSCSSITSLKQHVFGKASQKQAAAIGKINTISDKQNDLNEDRLKHIGAWAAGTDLALQKATNSQPAIEVARQTNERVIAFAEKPDFNELQEVFKIVNTYLTNQAYATQLLEHKDKIIIDLNKTIDKNNREKDELTQKALTLGQANAAQADSYKAVLSKMDSYFGLGAIGYGLKRLITSLAWFLGISAVLYVIILVAATANPEASPILMGVNAVAKAILSVFENIFSFVFRGVKVIAPKAANIAGYVEQRVFNSCQQQSDGYKQTLTHIVDCVQFLKEQEKNGKAFTLDDLLNEVAKSMDSSDKQRVDDIKKDLNYK